MGADGSTPNCAQLSMSPGIGGGEGGYVDGVSNRLITG